MSSLNSDRHGVYHDSSDDADGFSVASGSSNGRSDGSCCTEEGLIFLLGGLSTETMANTDWKEEAIIVGPDGKNNSGEISIVPTLPQTSYDHQQQQLYEEKTDGNSHHVYERAFQLSKTGQILKPPVKILDLSSENRGNILIATKPIQKGQLIFTERALEGAQAPFGRCRLSNQTLNSNGSCSPPSNILSNSFADRLYTVRGCQHCFRSLEPASSLSKKTENGNSESEQIPMSNLWPVLEYPPSLAQYTDLGGGDFVQRGKNTNTLSIDANSGRVLCRECKALFCSSFCAKSHIKVLGDCCICSNAIRALIRATCCTTSVKDNDGTDAASPSATQECLGNEVQNTDFADDEEASETSNSVDIDPVIVLAVRMFLARVEESRTSGRASTPNLFAGLCGEADDIPMLRLGSIDDESGGYTLQKEYEAVASAAGLTKLESESYLSSQNFHRIVAIAQRNAISLSTGSPFRPYYQSVMRNTGGRGSEKQKQAMSQVALVLGSENGKLTRDMDRMVEEKVNKILC
jgi:hypothetical protein